LGKTTNYPVIHALLQAQSDRCDILNLSLETTGERRRDEALEEAIADARDHGMIVVVAAGNDNRDAVDYPAAYPGATAVSAMGREGTFPRRALEEMTVSPPKGHKDPKEFIASFSNVGEQISVTALGVGVLSTLPGNDWGSCSGTSMAAPVVAGAAACLLSRNPAIYNMARNSARSDAIEQLLIANCVRRGFGPTFEGHGMPDPERV
jgi:subtilisin